MEFDEMINSYKGKRFSQEEYLTFENAALEKHEYYQGVIYGLHGHIIVPEEEVERQLSIIRHNNLLNS